MGPHSSEQGNHVLRDDWVKTGALQWGLTLPSKETTPHPPRSKRPSSLQWGLTLPSKETDEIAADTAHYRLASMGPHSSEQGNRELVGGWHTECRCFNGASLFRARKQSPLSAFWGASRVLQWGLTLPSKETRVRAISEILEKSLQWGLTLPSKETTMTRFILISLSGFNGASLFRARKL